MITAQLENGNIYKAKSYKKLVKALADELEQSKIEYMAGVARRCEIWDGSVLKYDCPKTFVEELVRVGVIVRLFGSE